MHLYLVKKSPEERFRDPEAYYERRRKDMLRTNPDLLGVVYNSGQLDREQIVAFFAAIEILDVPIMLEQAWLEQLIIQGNLMEEFFHWNKTMNLVLESHLMFLEGEKSRRDRVRWAIALVLRAMRLSA